MEPVQDSEIKLLENSFIFLESLKDYQDMLFVLKSLDYEVLSGLRSLEIRQLIIIIQFLNAQMGGY